MGIVIGDVAPEFQAQDAASVTRSLQTSETPFTLLTFWKTSCSACEVAFPYLARIAKSYPRLVTVIGVVQDVSAVVGAEVAREWGANFPIISDQAPFPISLAYDPMVTPTMFLIDNTHHRVSRVDQACIKADLNELSRKIAESGGVPAVVVAPENDGNPAWTPG